MHNHQHNLKTHNMSKLSVIGLSIILITGISLVPALQIRVQGQQSPAPPSPGGSPSSGTPPPPSAVPRPPSPGGSPSSGTPPPPALDTADGGEAANQTGGEGGGAVNQSAMVMIPQNSMEMIMSHVQDAMTAIDVHNKDNATKALQSLIRELKSAANARGISIETTTTG
jgi:hypothetical protein